MRRLARSIVDSPWPIAVAVVALAGCGLEPAPLPVSRHDRIVQRAEEVRELPLLEAVEVRQISQQQYLAEREERVYAEDPERYAVYAGTYGRLGFFDRDVDQRLLRVASGRGIAGYYLDGAITLIGDEIEDDVYVHEIVHALQDQHFGIRDFVGVETTHAYVARRAVSEGGAELARERFNVQEEQPGSDLDDLPWGVRIAEEVDQSALYLGSRPYPVVFAATAGIAYSHGLIYCAHHLLGVSSDQPVPEPAPHDWERQNALWSAPPARTEQVLELDEADAETPVGITEVPQTLSNRLELVDWDILGRWHSYLLFFPLRNVPGFDRPWDLGAAWDGDAALFVQDLQTEEIGVVWTSRWDDEIMAGRVVQALTMLHGLDEDLGLTPGTAPDGEAVWLERRGASVVFLRNVDASVMPDLVEAAFDPEVAVGEPRAERVGPSFAAWLDGVP